MNEGIAVTDLIACLLSRRTVQAALASSCILAGAANATTIGDAIMAGKPDIDLRARYEDVDDSSKPLLGQATTLRARLGYVTGSWHGLKFLFDVDQIWTVGGATYNSTRNGKTAYGLIADPSMTALDRLQLSYDTGYDTTITVGRQRILIGNQRFVGNVGWRQHEQTYDSVSAVSHAVKGLTLTYAYLYRVNRVLGPEQPANTTAIPAATAQAPYFKSNSHIMDAVYTGIAGLRLEGFAFLLDLGAPAYATSAAQVTAVNKLSTATYGARADYSWKMGGGMAGKISGEYAHQTDYAHNPLHYGLDYWLGQASLSYAGLTGLVGYESLGGNGTIGFSTPLATLHAFNGWADLFLATPVNGLDDGYVSASYLLPLGFADLKSLKGTAVYHRYTTAHLNEGIGSEWDLSAELTVDSNASFLVKYAAYQGSNTAFGGSPDKSIFWLQAAYKV